MSLPGSYDQVAGSIVMAISDKKLLLPGLMHVIEQRSIVVTVDTAATSRNRDNREGSG